MMPLSHQITSIIVCIAILAAIIVFLYIQRNTKTFTDAIAAPEISGDIGRMRLHWSLLIFFVTAPPVVLLWVGIQCILSSRSPDSSIPMLYTLSLLFEPGYKKSMFITGLVLVGTAIAYVALSLFIPHSGPPGWATRSVQYLYHLYSIEPPSDKEAADAETIKTFEQAQVLYRALGNPHVPSTVGITISTETTPRQLPLDESLKAICMQFIQERAAPSLIYNDDAGPNIQQMLRASRWSNDEEYNDAIKAIQRLGDGNIDQAFRDRKLGATVIALLCRFYAVQYKHQCNLIGLERTITSLPSCIRIVVASIDQLSEVWYPLRPMLARSDQGRVLNLWIETYDWRTKFIPAIKGVVNSYQSAHSSAAGDSDYKPSRQHFHHLPIDVFGVLDSYAMRTDPQLNRDTVFDEYNRWIERIGNMTDPRNDLICIGDWAFRYGQGSKVEPEEYHNDRDGFYVATPDNDADRRVVKKHFIACLPVLFGALSYCRCWALHEILEAAKDGRELRESVDAAIGRVTQRL